MIETVPFNENEIAELRSHGIAFHANRVIFNAQPPIDLETLTDIAGKCEGPLPQDLVDLWSFSAGGNLDYDLTLTMDGQNESVAWTELFYRGATTYHDLDGWIESELELIEEMCDENGTVFRAKTSFLPIGGFEYLDRIYVCVSSEGSPHANSYGEVSAWKRGLPPAWKHRLHNDSVAVVGPNVLSALSSLYLTCDPRHPTEPYAAGTSLMEYLDERKTQGLSDELVTRVLDYFVLALRDWRPSFADGSIVGDQQLCNMAIEHALHTDDAALINSLHALGETFDRPLRGSARPVSVALNSGAFSALRAMLRFVDVVDPYSLIEGGGALPEDVVTLLLQRGALAQAEAVIHVAASGSVESARLISTAMRIDGYSQANLDLVIDEARQAEVAKTQQSLDEVRAGKLHHYLGVEGLEARLATLNAFRP
jgi:hypothetical protein